MISVHPSAGYAVADGEELGPIGPLRAQIHLNDLSIPQEGIVATGRVFVTPVAADANRIVPTEEVQ